MMRIDHILERSAQKKFLREIPFAILAFWSANAAVWVLAKEGMEVLAFPVSIVLWWFFHKAWDARPARFSSKRENILFWLCAAALAGYIAFGLIGHGHIEEIFHPTGLLAFAVNAFKYGGLCVLCLFALSYAVVVATRPRKRESKPLPPLRKRWFFVFFASLFLAYGLFYIAVYPGTFTVDSFVQIGEFLNHTFENWHPVLHTLLLGGLMTLGGGSSFLYFAVQISIMAVVISYALWWIGTRLRSRAILVCAWIYFLANPVLYEISVKAWKDSLFSTIILLLTIELAEWIHAMRHDRWNKAWKKIHIPLLCVAVLGTLFLRNNGAFVVIVLILCALIFAVGKRRKALLTGILVGGLCVFLLVQSVLFPAIGVKQTPLTEALAQPLQQFGRVIVNERALTTEEEALLSKILPIETWRKVYAPSTVDPVKFHGNPVEVYGVPVKFDGDFNGAVIAANKGAYAKLWLDLLLRYPRDYIAASFDETEMLWDFFVEPGLYYPDYESSSIRLDDPLFPAVRSFEYAAFAVLSESRYTGWFHALLKPIVHFTLSLFAMLVLLKKRQKRMLLAFVPIVALWISIFLTCPLSLVGRYIYSFFLCSPILLACAFKNERKC